MCEGSFTRVGFKVTWANWNWDLESRQKYIFGSAQQRHLRLRASKLHVEHCQGSISIALRRAFIAERGKSSLSDDISLFTAL